MAACERVKDVIRGTEPVPELVALLELLLCISKAKELTFSWAKLVPEPLQLPSGTGAVVTTDQGKAYDYHL